MEIEKQRYIFDMYGFDQNSNFSLLHSGENDTYVIADNSKKYILRQYRMNRFGLDAIQAEVEWLVALYDEILVPVVVRNKIGEFVTIFEDDNGVNSLFVVFEYIEGNEIEHPNGSDFEKLGDLMKSFHLASDKIVKNAPGTWSGWNRMDYNEATTIHDPLYQLLNAPFLSSVVKDRCIQIAESLLDYSSKYDLGDHVFLHGDMHFGNIIQARNGWYCLDFDESGFGYKPFDIGVPRLHLIARGQLKEMWPSFKSGYGIPFSDEAIRLGTSLRIFYMAGKIPGRLDIEDIKQQPEKFITRYLHFIEEELLGVT